MIRGYTLRDSEGVEQILVIRTDETDLLLALARRMVRMRDERLSELGKHLQGELDG